MINWHLEKRKISTLTPHPKNPRELRNNQEMQLRTSLDKFGLADKPIINTDGMIIGGHMRVRILKGKKIKEVECWVPDRQLEEQEVNELNIRLNKNTGEWDFDVLANEWELTDLVTWGFDPEELDIFINEEKAVSRASEEDLALTTCPKCGHEF
jgi:ParB-like chromosome segregation protein Spo0J